MSLTRAVHALKWSVGAEFASRAIQPLVFIILARLLVPADFGVMAAAMLVISFSQVFSEAGVAKAIVQRQNNVEGAASVAFWLSIGIGIVVSAVLFLAAPAIARVVFDDPRVTDVLRVMTVQVLLGSLTPVHTALLQKSMEFHRIFWVRLATVALPGAASIPLAVGGLSYWALVAGTLLGTAGQVIVLWRVSRWRPRFAFEPRLAAEVLRFGAWVSLSGMLAWFYLWADSFIVGIYLGQHELGLYRTGSQFIAMIFGLIFGPLLPVLYSYFSGLGEDRARIGAALGKVMRLIALIAIPLGFGIFIFADQATAIFFGPKWAGIELVIGVIALAQGLSWVIGANGEAYRALGKPSYETVVKGSTLAVYLLGYLISIQYGFEAFVWTRLGLGLIGLAFQLYFCWRFLGLALQSVLHVAALATIAGAALYLCHAAVFRWSIELWLQVVVVVGSAFVIAMIASTQQIRSEALGFLRLVRQRKASA